MVENIVVCLNMMKNKNTFIISDTHFGHKNMIKFENMPARNKFKSIADMDEYIIENWNSVVGQDDIVYHLGDFSLSSNGYTNQILERLNGNICLIIGNHDSSLMKSKNINHFTSIQHYKEINYVYKNKNYQICMMHYPIAIWNRMHYGSIHFFGHQHNNFKQKGRCCDVGVDTDLSNFKPILIEDAIEHCLQYEITKL